MLLLVETMLHCGSFAAANNDAACYSQELKVPGTFLAKIKH